jgi:hypothetical protein
MVLREGPGFGSGPFFVSGCWCGEALVTRVITPQSFEAMDVSRVD